MKDEKARNQCGIKKRYGFCADAWYDEPSPTLYEQVEAIKTYLGIRIIENPEQVIAIKIETKKK